MRWVPLLLLLGVLAAGCGSTLRLNQPCADVPNQVRSFPVSGSGSRPVSSHCGRPFQRLVVETTERHLNVRVTGIRCQALDEGLDFRLRLDGVFCAMSTSTGGCVTAGTTDEWRLFKFRRHLTYAGAQRVCRDLPSP
jgi:hypothetical protein